MTSIDQETLKFIKNYAKKLIIFSTAYIQGYFSIEKNEEIGSFLYKSLGSYEREQMIKDMEKDSEFIHIRVFIKETLKKITLIVMEFTSILIKKNIQGL